MRIVTEQQRRQLVVARHHLAGDAAGPAEVVRALIALHATDPASVYLSVLARSTTSTLSDIANAMYADKSLVRWLAMRRTLFVFDRNDIPIINAAVGHALARRMRAALLSRLVRNGTDPAITGDIETWLNRVSDAAVVALERRGTATGAQLAREEPRLSTTILARTKSEQPQNLTSSLLTVLGAEGRIVRGDPTGAWTSRHHLWEPSRRRWPHGLPPADPDDARRALAQRWLDRFGPATVDDLQWWTGWSKTVTLHALSTLPIEEIDLHGRPGIDLRGTRRTPADDIAPTAALLPALDPTPMGWKHREWFLATAPQGLFDRAGNIGPTIWWDGHVVGSWAVTHNGDIRTSLLGDWGYDAAHAVERAAMKLWSRLDGAVVTPAARTPAERALSGTLT